MNDGDGGSVTATRNVVVTGSAINQPPTVTIQTPIDGAFGVASLFTLTATDADAIDQSGLFTYSVVWGDGTTSTVTGPRVTTISKTYAGVSPTGTFTIRVSARDARGAVSSDTVADFAVLGWTVMVDPIRPGRSILVVVGSQGEDDIKIQDKHGDYLRVKIKDRDDEVKYRGTVTGDVDRILIFGLSGKDKITIDDDIDIDARIWGGSGDDEIKGGSGNDVVFGESGNDKLYGGDGRDLLIGGTGADRIYGDSQDDILVAGFTAFDQEFNQLAPSSLFPASARLTLNNQRLAVEAIMAEWTSGRTYNQRRANITGTGTGPRSNGSQFFKSEESLAANNTVFDDDVKDSLWGDAGFDWFLSNSDGASSTRDDVKDRSGSEVQSDTDRWW
jgi:Ca2+-binding RTX toxin-like protein